MVLEVVELVFIHPAGSELARTRLALVRLQVMRIKPLCTAVLANKFRVLRTEVGLDLPSRPVLHLITSVASQKLLVRLELRPPHPFSGGRCALHAVELLPLTVLEVVELVFIHLAGSELARTRLALVRLQVTRTKPLRTAGLANKFRVFKPVGSALVYRPVLPLITFAASELWIQLRLTFSAHQARFFRMSNLMAFNFFDHSSPLWSSYWPGKYPRSALLGHTRSKPNLRCAPPSREFTS